MATAQEVAAFVAKKRLNREHQFLVQPDLGSRLDFICGGASPPVHDPIEALAQELYADAEWKALRLATFMNTPDGKRIAEGVGMVIPFQPEYDLWVQAMQKAAQMQYTEGSRPAGRLALTASVLVLLISGLAIISRQQS